jgi:hypothetical protein
MRVSEAGGREDFPVERDEDELRVGDVCKGVRGRKNSKQQLTDTTVDRPTKSMCPTTPQTTDRMLLTTNMPEPIATARGTGGRSPIRL